MKRILALLLLLVLPLSLWGCAPKAGPAFEETALQADAEGVVQALMDNDFAAVSAKFAPAFAERLDEATLKAGWDAASANLGAHVGHVSTQGAASGESYIVKVVERYEENGLLVQVAYDPAGAIVGLQCTYTYVEPLQSNDEYTEAALTVCADPAAPLGGTLTLPVGVEKPPVVILVQGSGSSDRNETVYANKPFADIAHGLARAGIATLRYDKRYYVYPDMALALGSTVTLRDEVLDDVDAAIALMQADTRVDPARIYVLGHSLGGMLTPAIAADHPELAGVISMAGSLRPLWEILYDQNQEALAAMDKTALSTEELAALDAQTAQMESDIATLRGDFSALAEGTTLLGVPVGYWKSLSDYSGANFIDQAKVPMLILQGDADFQVYPDKDYALWEETLAGRSDVTLRLYPGLNHLFMPTQGRRDLREYEVKGNVDPQVIADIAAFVKGA